MSLLLLAVSSCNKDNSTTVPGTYTSNIAFSLGSGSETLTKQSYTMAETDGVALYVYGSALLNLSYSRISTSGDATSLSNSLLLGAHAAAVTTSGSTLNLIGNKVKTTGTGSNGVYAYSTAIVTLLGDSVTCSGANSHALASNAGGSITANGVTLQTTGSNASAIYSGGTTTIKNSKVSATNSEAAAVQANYSLNILNSNLTSSAANLWGVLIFRDSISRSIMNQGIFSMAGGSLSYTPASGPLFFVTNAIGIINLSGVALTDGSNTLVRAAAGSWGKIGANGGQAIVNATAQTLNGNFVADAYSTLNLLLQNSIFIGAFNPDNKAYTANISLDDTSTWTLTADSYISGLDDAPGISGTSITNITGNGHNIYYQSAINPDLGGKTYSLVNGGQLMPY